jgi:hypothetical protein
MGNKTRGYFLVGLQFILLIALFVIPRNEQVLQNAAWFGVSDSRSFYLGSLKSWFGLSIDG